MNEIDMWNYMQTAVNTGDTLIILTGLSTAGGLDASDFI